YVDLPFSQHWEPERSATVGDARLPRDEGRKWPPIPLPYPCRLPRPQSPHALDQGLRAVEQILTERPDRCAAQPLRLDIVALGRDRAGVVVRDQAGSTVAQQVRRLGGVSGWKRRVAVSKR